MEDYNILVVDDEADMLETCKKILQRKYPHVKTSAESCEALEFLRQHPFDLMIVDLRMPGCDGIQVMKEAKQIHSDLIVIIITAYATIETAVKAVREGAFDYIPKPFSMEQLELAVERCFAYKKLMEENKNLRSQLWETYHFEKIIGKSPPLLRALEMVAKVAGTDANILIFGESGTGKELIARSIHANSSRSTKPFVPIDCASLPETLLESELFGYEKGAFTGAITMKKGLLESASGGTLFLDEVANLSLHIQAKLLRVLEERQFRRVGGRELIDVDLRIISAVNRNIAEMRHRGEFREDLFYRLNVVNINLPPLRERGGDVSILAQHFIDQFKKQSGKSIEGISTVAMMILERYDWPGNVRELKNAIQRAVSLTESNQISPLDLPRNILEAASASAALPAERTFQVEKKETVQCFECEYLRQILMSTNGNVSVAAKRAGMKRSALQRLMKKYHLHSAEFRKL